MKVQHNNTARLEDVELEELDTVEEAINLDKTDKVTKKVWNNKVIVTVVAMVAVVVMAVSIGVAVSSAIGRESVVQNSNLNGCQALSEAEKQAIREVIAEEARFSRGEGFLVVSLTDTGLGCLPNEALSLLQVRDEIIQESNLRISLTDCQINDIEEGAFRRLPFVLSRNPPDIVIVDLSKNQLTSLPDLVFAPFRGSVDVRLILGDNTFEALENELNVFNIPFLTELVLDENNFERLPVVSSRSDTTTQISCKRCSKLQFIDRDYCAFTDAELLFPESPLALAGKTLLSSHTTCAQENMELGSPSSSSREVTSCEVLTAFEKVSRRRLLFENLLFRNRINFIFEFTSEVKVDCLPDDAFFFVDFEVLPSTLSRLDIRFQNRGIIDMEEGAFRQLEEKIPSRVEFTLRLDNNQLSSLKESVFAPFRGRSILTLNLGGNNITELPSTLLDEIFVERLFFSGNGFRTLPFFPNLLAFPESNREVFIVCNQCAQLSEIKSGYCDLILDERVALLSLEDTPLQDFPEEELEALTGCDVDGRSDFNEGI